MRNYAIALKNDPAGDLFVGGEVYPASPVYIMEGVPVIDVTVLDGLPMTVGLDDSDFMFVIHSPLSIGNAEKGGEKDGV